MARIPADADYLTDILPSMLLMGVGAGLAFPSLMTLAMSGATSSDSGLASGLVNTSQQVGGALGLAVLTSLATSRTDVLLADGQSNAAALTDGYQLAWWIGAALLGAAILIALAVLQRETVAEAALADPAAFPEPEPARSEAA
jgi:hypothetical protein